MWVFFDLPQPARSCRIYVYDLALKLEVPVKGYGLPDGIEIFPKRWIRKGELSDDTFAADCFKGKAVPDRLEPVPATAWLFEKCLTDNARIWEHSVALPSCGAVLSLLVMREPVEAQDESDPADEELDPNEFTLNRRRWPSKR